MKRFLERVGRERGTDLESLEFGLRQAVLSAGARLLENLLVGIGSGRREQALHCDCGGQMQSAGQKGKRIKTVLGDVHFLRSLYVCEACGRGRFPGDHILDVVETMFSPACTIVESARNSAAWPDETASAPTPPSSAAIRSSNTAVVGFMIRV